MTARDAPLVAIDGVNTAAVEAEARAVLAGTNRQRRGGISRWDASGVFEELAVAGVSAGDPSARTLVLLYAADLAFRLRWEIRPALAEGRLVVAAPYVDTAIAFGRAAGLRGGWLRDVLKFAPRPTESRYVDAAAGRSRRDGSGFLEFVCGRLSSVRMTADQGELIDRTRTYLLRFARRGKSTTTAGHARRGHAWSPNRRDVAQTQK